MDKKLTRGDRVWEGGHTVVDYLRGHYSKYADLPDTNAESREASLLFCIAETQIEDGDLEEAMTASENALELFRSVEDVRGICDTHRLIIHVYRAKADEARNRGERADARDLLEKAEAYAEEELSNYRDVEDDRGQAAMLLSMAEAACAYRGSTKREEALDNAEEARGLFREVGDVKMEAVACQMIAEVYFRKRNFHASRRSAAEAIELFKSIEDKLGMAMAFHMASATEARSGALEMAVRFGRKSVKLLQEVGTKRQQLAGLVSLGQWYLMREDTRAALSIGEAALLLLQDLEDNNGWEAPTIGFMIEAHILGNEADKALDLVKDGIAKLREKGAKSREVVHLMHHLLHVHAAKGQLETCREVFEDAMLLAKELSCRRLQAHLYEELSHAYVLGEDHSKALDAAKEAVALLKDLGADHDEITTRLQVLGKVHILKDEFQEAQRQINIAKDIAQRIDEKPLEAFCLSVQSRVQALLGDPSKGVKAADLAIDLFREDGDRRGECRVWEGLAEIHMAAGDYASAMRSAKKSQAICEDVGDQRLLARIKHTISMVHMSAEEHAEALAAITDAVKLSRADDDMRGTIRYIFLCLDTHLSILTAMDTEDKSKVRVYRQGCEKAMRLAKESVGLSIRIGDRQSESMAQYWVGTMHVMMGRPKEARAASEISLEIALERKDRITEAYAKGLQVQIFLQEKNHSAAVALFNEIQALSKELGEQQVKTMVDQLKELVFGSGAQEAAAASAAAASAAKAQAAASAQEAATPAAGGDTLSFVGPDPDLMKNHIIAMVKNMTGGAEEVDADTPLMESGVDSLASVELRTQLQQEFKVPLPSTVMFNYPTIGGITGLLVDELTQKKITWSG